MSIAMRSAATRASLADPDLEQPQPAVLDRELDVAQVGVVALEQVRMTPQLVGDRGQPLVERRRSAAVCVRARDDVLALRVEQDVAVQGSARRSTGCA